MKADKPTEDPKMLALDVRKKEIDIKMEALKMLEIEEGIKIEKVRSVLNILTSVDIESNISYPGSEPIYKSPFSPEEKEELKFKIFELINKY